MKKNKLILLMKFPLIFGVIFSIAASVLISGEPITFGKEFSLFTSKNAQGYFKPLFTTIGESINSNLYSQAKYQEMWSFGLDLSVMGMFIPNSQLEYDAQLPEKYGITEVTQTAEMRNGVVMRNGRNTSVQPTIYGGMATPVFSAPQYPGSADSVYKSVAYAEGNDISFMSGLPVIQLIFGMPTRTQLRLKFLAAPVQDETMIYFGANVNQQIDHFFDLFGEDSTWALGLNLAYQVLSRDPGISMNSFCIGIHGSKYFTPEFWAYAGLQYEGMSGTFEAERESWNPNDTKNSPYQEIRNGEDLKFDIESFTSIRFLGGLAYRWSFLEFHADAAYASQPVLSFGISFWFGSFK